MTTDEELDDLWRRRDQALYRIEVSILYHQKRERFFDFLDKSAKAIAVIGGSAAFAKLGDQEWAPWIPWIAATITVTSTLSLVGGFSEKARRHSELASRFCLLVSKMMARGERTFTEDDLSDWQSKTREIEAAEPGALGGLVELCEAQIYAARGQPFKLPPLWQRPFVHFLDFHKVPPKPAANG